jgi:predicted outer membrane repeat protein
MSVRERKMKNISRENHARTNSVQRRGRCYDIHLTPTTRENFLMSGLLNSVRRLAIVATVAWSASATATNGVVSPPNCNDVGFTNVFNAVDASGGGTVTFNCGGSPATITFAYYKLVTGNDVIDGGNRIVFDGAGTYAFFQVFSDAGLSLKNLTLQHGAFNQVHALENFGTLNLSGVTVKNNVSTDTAIENFGTLTATSSTFTGNGITSAGSTQQGGALRNDGGNVQISNSTFSGNAVNGGSSGEGGAIANASGGSVIVASSFTGNKGYDGGAVQIASGTISVKSSSFTTNTAAYGAGIENDGGSAFVSNSTFTGNTSNADGGAIWNLFGTSTIDSSQFVGNHAGTIGTGGGGAISCYGSTLTLTNSAFASNQSGTTGGAIYSSCGLAATNNTFYSNTATGAGGGAIYQQSSQNAMVTYATIVGNEASTFGGGIYNDGASSGTMTLSKSIISANNGGNCDGVIVSGGYNLSNDGGCGGVFGGSDLSNATLPLGTFANNGGPTSTLLPQSGNQAVSFVPVAQCVIDRDQRDAARPAGVACDSGAVELNGIFDAIFASGFDF